jgi:hypothetical protein
MPRSNKDSAVDTRTVLKTYNISSVNPKKWQDTSTQRPKQQRGGNDRRQNRYSVLQDQRLDFVDDEEETRSQDIVEDEQDPLGVIPGGVFRYLFKLPSSSLPLSRVLTGGLQFVAKKGDSN